MIKTGYIYKIYDNTNGNVYYGSTKESYLSSRIAKHRNDYKKYLEGKGNFYKSFDILKNNDYSYSVVEKIEYNEKYELHQKERFYIENNECINKCIPNRTKKEWTEANKDKMKECIESWRENNKEKIKQKTKEYREKNKENILEKKRIYNKEYNKIKANCPHCGLEMLKANINRHIKRKH